MNLREHQAAAREALEELERVNARLRANRATSGLDPDTGRAPGMPAFDSGLVVGGGVPGLVFTARPNAAPPPPDPAERRQRAAMLLGALPDEARKIALDGPEIAALVVGGAPKVGAARRAFAEAENKGPRSRNGHVVLVGPAGSGKTALAAAWLRGRILGGAWSAWFVPAIEIGEERVSAQGHRLTPWSQLAEDAADLVLDDLGAELTGAPIAGGLAAQRMEAIHLALHRRKQAGRAHVITTPHDRPTLARIYGDGIARRVFEGAAVVRLGGAA